MACCSGQESCCVGGLGAGEVTGGEICSMPVPARMTDWKRREVSCGLFGERGDGCRVVDGGVGGVDVRQSARARHSTDNSKLPRHVR